MDFTKHAFILNAIRSLRARGSWTGKTHVNKALSLLRDRGKIGVPFAFVLYKHGPYSFDVETELEQMQSYGAVTIEPDARDYGVRLDEGEMGYFVDSVASLSQTEREAIDSVCEFVGTRNVADLERLSTASWIRSQEKITSSREVAKRLHALKPHIAMSDAEKADSELNAWLQSQA